MKDTFNDFFSSRTLFKVVTLSTRMSSLDLLKLKILENCQGNHFLRKRISEKSILLCNFVCVDNT